VWKGDGIMIRRTRLAALVCLGLSPAFAAVDGVVINGTTGKPQPNVIVSLVQPSQGGMQNLGSAKTDAEGKFRIDKEAQGPQLVQAFYAGVQYNKMVFPGAPATGVQVDVFDSSNKSGVAKVTQHFIVLQPAVDAMTVSEGILYQDDGKTTFNDPVNGSCRFYLPPEAKGQVTVTVNAPGGMPIKRPAEATKEPNVYKVSYPLKPGETRFDLNYVIPTTNPMVFSTKILHAEGASDLVVPNGVTAKGDDIELAGQEPKTQASIYRIKNASFKVEVEGTGALTQPDASAPQGEDDSGQPTIQEVKPRIYDRLYWILGMSFAILGLGAVLLSRNASRSS
jgi:hypothetical protein